MTRDKLSIGGKKVSNIAQEVKRNMHETKTKRCHVKFLDQNRKTVTSVGE